MAGNANSGRISFYLDESAPFRRQVGENERDHGYIVKWREMNFPPLDEMVDVLKTSIRTLTRISKEKKWQQRRDLYLVRTGKPMAEQMYGKKATMKRSVSANAADEVLPTPDPIKRGLHAFCAQYAHHICPGYQEDSVMTIMLTELEKWVEGETEFLMLIPYARAGKSTAVACAMVYSMLRFPTRPQLLVSASSRLSTIACANMKTIFEQAVEAPYGCSYTDKSKSQWKANWQNAGLQLAASRSSALLGISAVRALVDDPLMSVNETESTQIMSTTMRMLTTDVLSRRTPCSYDGTSGVCLISQRLAPTDVVAELAAKDTQNEEQGLPTTPWRVIATPFLTPTLEEQGKIVGDLPGCWNIIQPKYTKQSGEPVSERFTIDYARILQAQMSERDYRAIYLLDVSSESYCSWKDRYLQEIEEEDIFSGQTVMAVDLNMAGGDKGSDKSALSVGCIQDGNVVILGLHFLEGDVNEQLAQILDYAERYSAFVCYLEKAGAGHAILNSLSGNLGARHVQVKPISHKGMNKGQRMNLILGPAASKRFFIKKGLKHHSLLNQQLKLIAVTKGKTKKADDMGDCVIHLLHACWEYYVKSGWNATSVSYQGGAGTSGVTECSWGYGDASLLARRRGIDGVERYQLPGFD